MKSIIISPLYPPTDIYGSTDPDNLQLIVSGYTGASFTLTGITDDTVYYTVKVVGFECEPITKTFTFTVTPTPTTTPTQTVTPSVSKAIVISWSPYDPYCIKEVACPTGMVMSEDKRVCAGVVYTGATAPTGPTVYVNNATNKSYCNQGARLYQLDGYDSHGDPLPGFGFTMLTAAPLWRNPIIANNEGDLTSGRLNQVGVWTITGGTCNTNFVPTTFEWVGFSKTITIPESKIYYIGLAGDNVIRFKVNGSIFVEQTITTDENHFDIWHIYPVRLPAGSSFIELEGYNTGGPASFGAEIYNMTAQDLIAATNESQLNTILSTKDFFCQPLQTGTNSGWSCPAGWSLDFSTPSAPRCAMRLEQDPQTRNTGYKAYKYRRRLQNNVADGYVEENLSGSGIGTYFPPVADPAYCPVGTIEPTPTVTPTVSLTPSLTPTKTVTPTPTASPLAVMNNCLIVADDATVLSVSGNKINGGADLKVTITGMQGGYFGLNAIYSAFFISSASCRPCRVFTGDAWFTNDTTGVLEMMNLTADGTTIRFDGYLDPAYRWSAEITIPLNCNTGGGWTCMLKGTKVTLADGSYKNIEDIRIGDQLMSLRVDGLLPEAERVEEWYSDTFSGIPGITTVVATSSHQATKMIRINRALTTTPQHKHFINRNGKYLFEQAENIKVGDYMFYESGDFVYVNLVEPIFGQFDTFNIDVEDLDVYFVNGLLTHNKEIPIDQVQ